MSEFHTIRMLAQVLLFFIKTKGIKRFQLVLPKHISLFQLLRCIRLLKQINIPIINARVTIEAIMVVKKFLKHLNIESFPAGFYCKCCGSIYSIEQVFFPYSCYIPVSFVLSNAVVIKLSLRPLPVRNLTTDTSGNTFLCSL